MAFSDWQNPTPQGQTPCAPFRFSTKYYDVETNLIYYGRRYYSPMLGRFISRDPKQEAGGFNLYAFVLNNAINRMDYLGMDPVYNGGWLPKMTVRPGPDPFGGFGGFGGFGFDFVGGNGGSGGSSSSDGGPTSDDPTAAPDEIVTHPTAAPDEIETLPRYKVSGTRPVEPVTPRVNPNPIDPDPAGAGGQTTEPAQTNNASNNKDKDREQLKKDCEGLSAQMNDLSRQFANMANAGARPANPMSGAELGDAIYANASKNIAGILSTLSMATPTGFATQTAEYIGTSAQAGRDFSQGEFDLLDGLLVGISAAGFADTLSTATSGRQLLTQAGRTAVRRAGVVGAVVTAGDVLAEPLVEYRSRSRSWPATTDSRVLQHEWQSNFAPRIEALVKIYNAKGCSAVMSGN